MDINQGSNTNPLLNHWLKYSTKLSSDKNIHKKLYTMDINQFKYQSIIKSLVEILYKTFQWWKYTSYTMHNGCKSVQIPILY